MMVVISCKYNQFTLELSMAPFACSLPAAIFGFVIDNIPYIGGYIIYGFGRSLYGNP